ncbi:hypothetical protein G7Y79_00075g099170 [Physcia stellaris]|nr:hypothetical protein G7Y79_00075g099170 [Physcia stellaris]
MWAANIGAHKTGQSSLDFRLRDASHIRNQILKLLKHVEASIDSAQELLFERPDSDEETFSDDDGDDEGEAPGSILEELLASLAAIIKSLFQLSMLVRKPAQHDLYAGSSRADVAAFEPFYYRHVRDKFPDANESLISRLGSAIARRKMYLKYRERHAAKLRQGINTIATGTHGETNEGALTVMSETVATDLQNWNIDFEESASASGESQTSYAATLMRGGNLTIPPPPKESLEGNPFECPLCYHIVTIESTQSWNKHVFLDLQPYMCLDLGCKTPQKLYATRHDWLRHRKEGHPDECDWKAVCQEESKCPLCGEGFQNDMQLDKHNARHLQDLALFVLPQSLYGINEEEEDPSTQGSRAGNEAGSSSVEDLDLDSLQSQSKDGPPISSYWSLPDQTNFNNLIHHFGTNWQAIADHMKTKTQTMVKNYYYRQVERGESKLIEQAALAADEKIKRGEDMGQPPPLSIRILLERRYDTGPHHVPQIQLAPSVDHNELETGSSSSRNSASDPSLEARLSDRDPEGWNFDHVAGEFDWDDSESHRPAIRQERLDSHAHPVPDEHPYEEKQRLKWEFEEMKRQRSERRERQKLEPDYLEEQKRLNSHADPILDEHPYEEQKRLKWEIEQLKRQRSEERKEKQKLESDYHEEQKLLETRTLAKLRNERHDVTARILQRKEKLSPEDIEENSSREDFEEKARIRREGEKIEEETERIDADPEFQEAYSEMGAEPHNEAQMAAGAPSTWDDELKKAEREEKKLGETQLQYSKAEGYGARRKSEDKLADLNKDAVSFPASDESAAESTNSDKEEIQQLFPEDRTNTARYSQGIEKQVGATASKNVSQGHQVERASQDEEPQNPSMRTYTQSRRPRSSSQPDNPDPNEKLNDRYDPDLSVQKVFHTEPNIGKLTKEA